MKIERKNKIKTEFGNASINPKGHYRITSMKEGNMGKLLHRLIFEKYFGKIPKGYIIHHKNGDKLDNCLFNLQLMSHEEHSSYHNMDKCIPNDVRKKISKSLEGENNYNWKNYARVIKHGSSRGKQQYVLVHNGEYVKYSIFKDVLNKEAEKINKRDGNDVV